MQRCRVCVCGVLVFITYLKCFRKHTHRHPLKSSRVCIRPPSNNNNLKKKQQCLHAKVILRKLYYCLCGPLSSKLYPPGKLLNTKTSLFFISGLGLMRKVINIVLCAAKLVGISCLCRCRKKKHISCLIILS